MAADDERLAIRRIRFCIEPARTSDEARNEQRRGRLVDHLLDAAGAPCDVPVLDRRGLVGRAEPGPFLIIDPEATTFVMRGWTARGMSNGSIVLETA